MQSYKKEFAKFLVRAEALQFGEFTLKSGRSSPYFLNFFVYVLVVNSNKICKLKYK